MSLRGSAVVLVMTALVVSCSRAVEETSPKPPTPRATRLPWRTVPALAGEVEIRRTEYGVPHILAENLAAAGFGMGYSQMDDYVIEVVKRLAVARGELAMYEGREALDSDFAARERHARAVETYHTLSSTA